MVKPGQRVIDVLVTIQRSNLLSDIVSLLPSCFVSLLFLHSHNWRLPLCKLWHMCRAGHYHDLPHHDRNSGFWLPTKEWDCRDPRWYCVCLHPTKVFNAWSSGRFWYVVSFTRLHGVYSKITHQGDILGTRYFILTSIGRFSFFQCRFCWAAAMPRLSFDSVRVLRHSDQVLTLHVKGHDNGRNLLICQPRSSIS